MECEMCNAAVGWELDLVGSVGEWEDPDIDRVLSNYSARVTTKFEHYILEVEFINETLKEIE